MADPIAQGKEDAFHRLPKPAPLPKPGTQPFVGNDCLDDNVAECAQVALWNLHLAAGVTAHVAAGHVTLEGDVSSAGEREAAERAVRALNCVTGVSNALHVLARPSRGTPRRQAEPGHRSAPGIEKFRVEPMVYVTRYCSLEKASMLAAMHQGKAILDGLPGDLKPAATGPLIIVYRNRQKETITIDIGYRASTAASRPQSGEIKVGSTPSGNMISQTPGSGIAGLLAAHDALKAQASDAGWRPKPLFWQEVQGDLDVSLGDLPVVPIHLPVAR